MNAPRLEAGELWNIWATEVGGAPAGWLWIKLEVLEHAGPKRLDRIEGGIYSTLLKTGPRKGKPNYKKPDPGTARTFIIDFDEWKAWGKAWLVARGICDECEGEGRIGTRWSLAEGSFFKPCPKKCPGSRTAVLHEPATPPAEPDPLGPLFAGGGR